MDVGMKADLTEYRELAKLEAAQRAVTQESAKTQVSAPKDEYVAPAQQPVKTSGLPKSESLSDKFWKGVAALFRKNETVASNSMAKPSTDNGRHVGDAWAPSWDCYEVGRTSRCVQE